MKKYFDSQMRMLQDEAILFAKKHPEHARYLNIDSIEDRDPNVERLLEGFAYLTGRVQQQLDNGLLDVSEVLLDSISPKSLKATPSKAIAQYTFPKGSTNDVKTVTLKNYLISNSIGDEKTKCKFKLENNVTIYPIAIDNISQHSLDNGLYELHLNLSVNKKAKDFSIDSLSFYLNGESIFRHAWLYALLEKSHQQFILHQGNKTKISINHPILNDDINIDNCFGTEMLKDFFCVRDKFMFFELSGFDDLIFSEQQQIEFFFILKEPIEAIHINNKNSLLLGCASIINEFDYNAEPVNVNEQKHSQMMMVDSSKRQSILLQSIKSISSDQEKITMVECLPFRSYKANKKNIIYYRLQRDSSLLEINNLILSGGENAIKSQVLSIEVEACNGYYPRKFISSRQLYLDKKSSSLEIESTNITRPSEYMPPSSKQQYYWRLLEMLSVNYQSLSKTENLIENLHIYDVHQHYFDKINAIIKTEIQTKQQFLKGVLHQGIKYKLSIDESKFESHQELYLFGLLLHYFLLQHVEINHFFITEIKFVHQNKFFSWHCLQGKKVVF